MGHLLYGRGLYRLCGLQARVGGDQMISLLVAGGILLVILIYMAIVSYYI